MFKNRAKVLALVAILFFTISGVVACSYTAEQQYENFLADMDMITRFDLCIDKVEKGSASFYTEDELIVLQADIHSCHIDLQAARQANDHLINCADSLLASIHADEEGSGRDANQHLETALTHYQEAKAIIRLNNTESPNV